MLLVNSLKDKVENIQDNFSPYKSKSNHYHKKKKHSEGKLLFISKSNDRFFSDAEDGLLSNEDIVKRYTKERLHKCWQEKVPLNFNFNHKKFSDDIMLKGVKEAKAFVNSLVDPDRFENKQDKWDISTKADERKPPLLKKALFLINSQLNEWGAVPIVMPHVEEGVDSRYKNVGLPEKWNVSTQLIQQEKDSLIKQSRENDKNNTMSYWKKNESNRKTQKQFRISEERRRIESPRFYKSYNSPTIQTKKNYEIMNKIKQDLWLERERKRNEVIHDNPGCKDVKEKIHALVEEKMHKVYQEKFRVVTGKQRDNTKSSSHNNKHSQNWNDEEIINKIHTINNWKDIKWYKSKYPSYEMDEVLRQKLLQILVVKGSDIRKEQEMIQEMKNDKHKKQKEKRELKRCQSSIGIKTMNQNRSNKDNSNDNDNDFFEAYKKCAISDIEKRKAEKKLMRPKSCVDHNNYHPGIYVRLKINELNIRELLCIKAIN